MEQRVAELERRVQELECQVAEVLSRQEAPKPSRAAKARERMTSPLPKQFVSLQAEASRHNVAEAKVQTHMEMGVLPVKHGEWTDVDGTVVTLALDVKGRQAFYQLYRDLPHFTGCSKCPHGYLDTV
jgi:hypothetical protein